MASVKGYVAAGFAGLLIGLGIVAFAAFVVVGPSRAENAPVLVEGPAVDDAADPDNGRIIGQPPGAAPPDVEVQGEVETAPADDPDAATAEDAEGADVTADTDGDADTTTTLPQVIVDPELGEDDDPAPDDPAPDDPDEETPAPTSTTTSTTSTTTTSTTTTTTTSTTTTTAAPGPPTTRPGTPLIDELDRLLNLLPDDIEDLLVEVDVLGDQLSFGVRSEQDANRVDEFLSENTTAPYSIRLAG